jgi:hypothetical protein
LLGPINDGIIIKDYFKSMYLALAHVLSKFFFYGCPKKFLGTQYPLKRESFYKKALVCLQILDDITLQ